MTRSPTGRCDLPRLFEKKQSKHEVGWGVCCGSCEGNVGGQLKRKATTGRSQLAFRSAVAGASRARQPDLLGDRIWLFAAILWSEQDSGRRPASR